MESKPDTFEESKKSIKMENTHMETKMIGNKISEARKKLNISQAQLAKRLYISPQAVGKWERGESLPDIITLNRLAGILGVDLNYFSENIEGGIPQMDHGNLNPGEIDQTIQADNNLSGASERKVRIDMNAIDLQKADFAGVVMHKGKFKVSPLNGANFAGADLTGSSFEVSNGHQINFDGANLTDCNFSIFDLTGASFNRSILIRTNFNTLGLDSARFVDVKMTDVKMTMTDLRKTIFENCIFDGVHFKFADLRGLSFEGNTLIGVRFDKSSLNDVSFRGATLRDVTFILPFSFTNKSYLALKTVCFDGASMDKLTYVALKGFRVFDLSGVNVI